jgi:RNA polymerase sigma-70 factor (family 1)
MREGDQDAFGELYNRYNKSVYAYILSFVKVPEVAEDLVHEVFIKLWEIRFRMEIQSAFSAYLYRSCHNKAINTLKKATADRKLKSKMISGAMGEFETPSVLTATLHRYDRLVETALSQLPPQRRKVFTLIRQEGKSYNEVAQELGVSVNTVKDHLLKATRELKKYIKQTGEFALAIILLETFF